MTPRPAPPPASPNVRRSNRASLPDTYLMYRREIIRENFCKTPVQTAKKKVNGNCSAIKSKLSAKVQIKSKSKSTNNNNSRMQRYSNRQTKRTKLLNANSCSDSSASDDTADAQPLLPSTVGKTEKLDDTMDQMDIPKFVVTKDAAILSPMQGGIHPTYYPSEEDNSGVIVFKKHSPRLQLNVSFAKCFVILNGNFCINLTTSDMDEFHNGDFIKAPAGSKLGIKYMGDGDSDEYGKIIFFKSVS